jgi:hypothetical protein
VSFNSSQSVTQAKSLNVTFESFCLTPHIQPIATFSLTYLLKPLTLPGSHHFSIGGVFMLT